jgi:hypothetical protein
MENCFVLTNNSKSGIVSICDYKKPAFNIFVGSINMRRFWFFFVMVAVFAFFPYSAYACSTPVFRYAMERWPADYYEGIVIHKGTLTDDDPAAMLLQTGNAEFLNLRVSPVDLASPETGDLTGLLGGPVPESLPALVLWYPLCKGRAAPFWTGRFTPETIEALIQSPKRQELAKRLTDGQTAVWIFIESGNAGKDKVAKQLIKQELEKATKELNETASALAEELQIPEISYEFSILPVSRSDPKEQMLIEMLSKSEPDLDEYSHEPIVFPTFGRGRALFALVGEGINVDNLREAIAFITGPCGCEIKMLNPGIDLLMAENWDASVMQFYQEFYETAEEPLPELTGVFPEEPINKPDELVAAAMSESPQPLSAPAAKSVVETPEQNVHGFGVIGTTAISLAAILVAVGLGTFAVTRKKH